MKLEISPPNTILITTQAKPANIPINVVKSNIIPPLALSGWTAATCLCRIFPFFFPLSYGRFPRPIRRQAFFCRFPMIISYRESSSINSILSSFTPEFFYFVEPGKLDHNETPFRLDFIESCKKASAWKQDIMRCLPKGAGEGLRGCRRFSHICHGRHRRSGLRAFQIDELLQQRIGSRDDPSSWPGSPLCMMIMFVSSVARSTLDISKLPDFSDPASPSFA